MTAQAGGEGQVQGGSLAVGKDLSGSFWIHFKDRAVLVWRALTLRRDELHVSCGSLLLVGSPERQHGLVQRPQTWASMGPGSKWTEVKPARQGLGSSCSALAHCVMCKSRQTPYCRPFSLCKTLLNVIYFYFMWPPLVLNASSCVISDLLVTGLHNIETSLIYKEASRSAAQGQCGYWSASAECQSSGWFLWAKKAARASAITSTFPGRERAGRVGMKGTSCQDSSLHRCPTQALVLASHSHIQGSWRK